MIEMERIVGRLEEQGKNNAASLDRVSEKIERVEEKVDALLAFKWKIIGVAAAVSVVCNGVLMIAVALIRSH